MKFGGFKFGKSKDKEIVQEEELAEITDELPQEILLDDAPGIMPHAPLQELSLDSGEENTSGDALTIEEGGIIAEEEGEPIKLVEVQADPVIEVAPEPVIAPPVPVTAAPPANKDASNKDNMDLAASISNIFDNVEDEENPLVNLIKSLPDVAATELIDDLKEINDIIKDWQKK